MRQHGIWPSGKREKGGDVKTALMNQNTLPFVAPPGPLASAPVASAGNQNMFYMSTDFGLCKYVAVFKNEGSDWINCGIPSWLAGLTPNVNYFIDVVALSLATTAGYYFASTGSPAENLFNLYVSSAESSFGGGVGAGATKSTPTLYTNADVYKCITLINDAASARVTVDGSSAVFPKGAYSTPRTLFIGGRTDGATANYEGSIACFRVRNGSGAIIDTLDMNKWDGTSTMRFDSGHACTVTDGAPFTAKSYACIPWSVLKCP